MHQTHKEVNTNINRAPRQVRQGGKRDWFAWARSVWVKTKSDRAILIKLVSRADANRQCFPTIEQLADDTGLSTRTVITSIKRLDRQGLVTALGRNSRKTGNRVSNLYVLNIGNEPRLDGVPTCNSEGVPKCKSAHAQHTAYRNRLSAKRRPPKCNLPVAYKEESTPVDNTQESEQGMNDVSWGEGHGLSVGGSDWLGWFGMGEDIPLRLVAIMGGVHHG